MPYKVINLGLLLLLPVFMFITICECKKPSIHQKDMYNSCNDCDFKVLYHDMPKARCYTTAQRYARVIFLVNKQLNWFQANVFCRTHHMSLTTFKDLSTQLQIANKLREHSPCIGNTTSVWTGLNNLERLVDPYDDPDLWRGVGGEKLSAVEYEQVWDRTETQNPTHSVTERCIGITFEACAELLINSRASHGRINDANCYDMKRFICTKRYYI